MSKVIRISDSIFSRLQQYSVPLIDSPASVIERILDFYDKNYLPVDEDMIKKKTRTFPFERREMIGLYLAPANKENFDATIINAQPLSIVKSILPREEFEEIELNFKGKKYFRCWAMTKNSRSKFSSMKNGDIVLFTCKGTGQFSHCGKVICKLENAILGKKLWSVVPGLPWELIYFLDDLHEINISKEKVVSSIGYDQGYVVPGVIRVSSERVENIINLYGSISNFLSKLSS